MGQFGKKIQAEQIPGWSECYLDYKGLKKIMGSLRNTAGSGSGSGSSATTATTAPSASGVRPADLFETRARASTPRSSTPRSQPLLWDTGVGLPARASTPLAASSTGDEDRGQEFQMVKAAFFFKLQRELDKVCHLLAVARARPL